MGNGKECTSIHLKEVQTMSIAASFIGALNELYFDPKQWQWVDGLLLMNYTTKKRVEVV